MKGGTFKLIHCHFLLDSPIAPTIQVLESFSKILREQLLQIFHYVVLIVLGEYFVIPCIRYVLNRKRMVELFYRRCAKDFI